MSKVKNIAENNKFVIHIFHKEKSVILYVLSRMYSESSSFKVPFLFVKNILSN